MSERRIERGINQPVLMTRKTYELLQSELRDARQDFEASSQEIGRAAEGEWHDNAGYDAAILETRVKGARVERINSAVQNVEFIEPRQRTDVVGIGNEVEIRYVDEDGTERYLILGPYEAAPEKGIISYESLLGKALLQKRVGDTVAYASPVGLLEVTIVQILPGNF